MTRIGNGSCAASSNGRRNLPNWCGIVEVEKSTNRLFDALGRCLLWKCAASFVYLAFPKGKISKMPLLERFGFGLLEIDVDTGTVSELIPLPDQGLEMLRIQELHPLDFRKEQQLAETLQNRLR